ncbi:hypothetical protein BpHYR1_051077 [Brachionus plicatilis]|uniref:Uncharacterized protein n=1 Tax=Brachionus plicatilis TaxID=10195 RepID=A0A3M7QVB4_BRAPC|nr:hypothetical protein BpHYR1_051077 [Brachionus plicatilis]
MKLLFIANRRLVLFVRKQVELDKIGSVAEHLHNERTHWAPESRIQTRIGLGLLTIRAVAATSITQTNVTQRTALMGGQTKTGRSTRISCARVLALTTLARKSSRTLAPKR